MKQIKTRNKGETVENELKIEEKSLIYIRKNISMITSNQIEK